MGFEFQDQNWATTFEQQENFSVSAFEPPTSLLPVKIPLIFFHLFQSGIFALPTRQVGGIQVVVNVELIHSIRQDQAGNMTFFVDVRS